VTVTHPEMRRYFMTIPEAAQLVLLASTMGQGSEVFVLDMGAPVRIVDLAKQMIRLAGLIPNEQIQIRFTGMRPGEKLYEELITKGENIVPTSHKKIRIFQGPRLGSEELKSWLAGLQTLLEQRNAQGAVEHLKRLVPEYIGSAGATRRSQAGAA
jgi:FlaA1/EpsC-like NDP-sugar epimerase